LSAVFNTVGSALTTLSSTVDAQLTLLEQANVAVNGAVSGLAGISGALNIVSDAVLAAKTAIRIPAVADFQAQLDASLAIGLQLDASLSDPSAYLAALLAGLANVQASVSATLPTVQLEGQLAANLAISAALELKIAAVDLELDLLVGISASINAQAALVAQVQGALNAQLQALLGIQLALSVALAAISGALSAYAAMALTLTTAGAYCFLLDGPLSGLGAALDALTPSTGLSGATNVYVPVVLVQLSDTPAVTAVDAVFKTS
jgi:hypothetical protein